MEYHLKNSQALFSGNVSSFHKFPSTGLITPFGHVIILLLFLLLFSITPAFCQTETHPFLLYTSEDIDTIKERLSRNPYSSWFELLINEADGILENNVDWGTPAIPGNTQGYWAKILACAYVLSEPDTINHDAYGEEAALSLYLIPENDYPEYFSSDLEISEAALYWAETYDMLKGAGFDFNVAGATDMERTIRDKFSTLRDYLSCDWDEGFFPSVPSIQKDFLSVLFYDIEHTDNHHVKLYASLAALSLAIYDASGSPEDFSRAKTRLLDILDTMTITGDNGEHAGGWAEGPNYHLYSSHEYIPLLYSLDNMNIVDYSALPELVQTHIWLPRIIMPDGFTPPFDENEAVIFDTAGLLYSHHKTLPERDMFLWMWDSTGRVFDKEFLPDYITQFDDTPPVYANPEKFGWNPTAFHPESGFARFRNSWDNDAIYMLFLTEHGEARINGQAHENPDPNAFILHAFGDMLMLDSGYGGWSNRDQTRFAENHNLILVDGVGPEPASQEGLFNFWNANGEDAYLQEYFSSCALDYAVSKTHYSNSDTDFYRHIIFPCHRYFFLYDKVSNISEKTYTLLLHGNGGGTSGGTFAIAENGGLWTQKHAAIRSYSTGSSNLEFETTDMNHAVYNRTPMMSHTVLKVIQSGTDERFLTILYPQLKDSDMPDISALEVTNGTGIRIAYEDTTDYGCIRFDGSSMIFTTDSGNYATDSECMYCSNEPQNTISQFFFIQGTHLTSEQDTLVSTSLPVNVSVNYLQPSAITGHIQANEETDVVFHDSGDPLKVLFNDEEIPYIIEYNNILFTIFGDGEFRIELVQKTENHPPSILTTSVPDAVEAAPYSFEVLVEDPDDDDSILFEIIDGPGWLKIDENGILYGTPSNEDVTSAHILSLRAADTGGLSDTLMTTIRVTNVLNPPTNLVITDIPDDNGHTLKLTWDVSPDDEKGYVEHYRIYRSRSNEWTDPLPITQFTSIDSLVAWEQNYTVLIDSVEAGQTEYIDSSVLFNETLYYYWLQAVGTGFTSEKVSGSFITFIEKYRSEFYLKKPYPNPFNSSTMIEYSLQEDTHVVLTIYTISGQTAAVLKEGIQKAGGYAVIWNAGGMPSGLYFCTLRANGLTMTRKMLLLK